MTQLICLFYLHMHITDLFMLLPIRCMYFNYVCYFLKTMVYTNIFVFEYIGSSSHTATLKVTQPHRTQISIISVIVTTHEQSKHLFMKYPFTFKCYTNKIQTHANMFRCNLLIYYSFTCFTLSCAPSLSQNVTKQYPLLKPVIGSIINRRSQIRPQFSIRGINSSSNTSFGILPTNT